MKLRTGLPAAALAALLCVPALATEETTQPAAKPAAEALQAEAPRKDAATTKPASDAKAAKADKAAGAGCPQERGSVLRFTSDGKGGCRTSALIYRSYSKEDIDSTGETDLAQALRELDPIFR